MRAILGVVSLLVALAVVGIVAMKQLKAVDRNVGAGLPPVQQGTADAPNPAAPAATVGEQSRQVQQRVVGEITRSLEQGAARSDAAASAGQ